MLHALLPFHALPGKNRNKPTKFVDQGIPLLLDALTALGAKQNRLQTYIIGGAKMITAPGFNDWLNIGERNVTAARMSLQTAGLKISAQATGGHTGRTVKFYIDNGHITLKMLGEEGQLLQSATIRS
jgi:chemotaxis receptor (MCP) glutamine deamidase CheD